MRPGFLSPLRCCLPNTCTEWRLDNDEKNNESIKKIADGIIGEITIGLDVDLWITNGLYLPSDLSIRVPTY